MTRPCLIIAEAGVNHNGDIDMALELVDRAAEAGADVIKFQTFRADLLARPDAPKADYQERTTGRTESQYQMLKRLELSPEGHRIVMARCAERGIEFLSTAGETTSLDLLVKEFSQKRIKLGSGELTNAPLLLATARSGVEIILSTGMGTLGEVEEALGVLAFGMIGEGASSRSAFAATLHDPRAWEALGSRVTLLHCTTEYPAPIERTNLRAMETMERAFGLPVGYSDHSEGLAVSFAAVARGARMIEKHFTLDRALPGPDHAASVEPRELADLVRGIRAVESALGTGIKQPGGPELANRVIVRRSVVAARDLPQGHVLTEADLTVLRPGNGLSPMAMWDIVGSRLDRGVRAGEQISNL
ncbi:MAG: N-acetylneuraminate synthase [Siculibacillus sp.]|nr:N-acetylneuraminate synthase [Siculibacillus sp.]